MTQVFTNPEIVSQIESIISWQGKCYDYTRSGVPRNATFAKDSFNANVLREAAKRLLESDKVYEAAKALFANRLGWAKEANPYAPRETWADLAAALYGEDDNRVKELRPAPKFKPGDWVCWNDISAATAMLVGRANTNGTYFVCDPRPVSSQIDADARRLRLSTPEEISAALNG